MITLFVYYAAKYVRNSECWIRTEVQTLESFRASVAYGCSLFVVADNSIVRNRTHLLQDTKFIVSQDLHYLNLNSEQIRLSELNKQIRLLSRSEDRKEIDRYKALSDAIASPVFRDAVFHSTPVYAR